jgi:hypothetical protein
MKHGRSHLSNETQIRRARELGPMCVVDLASPSCAEAKRFLRFMNEEETELFLETELARTPPVGLPRPTILWRIKSHLAYVVGQRVERIAVVTPALSPHNRLRGPRPIKRKPTLWQMRPTSAHKAGESARFYKAVRRSAAALSKGDAEDVAS